MLHNNAQTFFYNYHMQSEWQRFLEQRGASFVDGAVAHFGNPHNELSAARDSTVLCDLSHLGLILASGDDAQAFLHGQFTNDLTALGDDSAQRNGYCSPKGRLLATFLVWRGKQGYFLQLPHDLQASVQKRLSMFVLRSKVKLEDASAQWVRIGVAGPAAEALVKDQFAQIPARPMTTWHGDAGRVIRLDANRLEIIGVPDKMRAIWETLSKRCVAAGSGAWEWLEISAGIPTILPATQDAFVPQMANFEMIGGVSFKKGCYPGQEIVARTQYRGILKRRMSLAHLDANATPKPGEKVYSAAFGDQAAGEIANAAPAPDGGFDILVVAQNENISRKDLHWQAPDGPALKLLPLPYPIPS
jgi:tRNA-modifying protein YgfZ